MELNHRHPDFQSGALPTELSDQILQGVGLEPTTLVSWLLRFAYAPHSTNWVIPTYGAGSRTWTCTRLAHWFLRPACLPFHHSRIRWLPRLDSNQGNVRVKVWCLTAWLRSNMVELTGIEPVSTNNPKLQISFLPYKFCPFSFDPLTIPPWKISSVVLLLKSILL